MNDQELLDRYLRQSDQDAFAQIVQRHVHMVHAAARRMAPADADDVTQTVFLLLSQKAPALLSYKSIAGWLYSTTRFSCIAARRAESRRQRREQEVAAMTKDTTTPPDQALLADLDKALHRLKDHERQAIVLRYLEGRSVEECAVEFGASAEAVRKRASRGLEKLRQHFAAAGHVSSIDATTALLAAQAAHRAGASVLAACTTAKSGTVASLGLAKATTKLIWFAKAKFAAALVAVSLCAVGTGVVVVKKFNNPSRRPGQNASQPFVSGPSFASESNSAGEVQLARWDIILKKTGADAIKAIATPLDTPSKVYQAFACDGAKLRTVIRDAMDNGGVEHNGIRMDIANTSMPPKLWLMNQYTFNIYQNSPKDRIALMGIMGRGDANIERTPTGRAKFDINFPAMHGTIQERTDQWLPGKPGDQATIYQGEQPAGQAIAFLGEYITPTRKSVYHLIVYETFKAQAEQMPYIECEGDPTGWIRNGPVQLKQWADAARAWSALALNPADDDEPGQPKVPPPCKVKLEDGSIARLIAISRPEKWPFCWWSPQGDPVQCRFFSMLTGNPQPGLRALVETIGEFNGTRTDDMAETAITDQTEKIDAGILVGPLEEVVRLKLNEPATIDSVTYLVNRPNEFASNGFIVHFNCMGVLDDNEILMAVDSDGKEHGVPYLSRITFGQKTQRRKYERQPNFTNIALKDVQYFVVKHRKRQWVTFTGFTKQPKTDPPTNVTAVDAKQAEINRINRLQQVQIDEIQAKRKLWAAISPDDTDPKGALRVLIDAARAGDEKKARQMLSAGSANVQPILDLLAHGLIQMEKLRLAAIARFGEPAVRAKLNNTRLCPDIESEMMEAPWTARPDGSLEFKQDNLSLRKNAAGHYQLECAFPTDTPDADAEFRKRIARVENLNRVLETNKSITLDELLVAAKPTPTTALSH